MPLDIGSFDMTPSLPRSAPAFRGFFYPVTPWHFSAQRTPA